MSRHPDAGLQLPADDSAAVHLLPALISAAERALAEARNFDEVKLIRDQASALRAFAEKIGADTRKLGEIKLRAEIRLGEELKKIEKAQGARGNPHGRGGKVVRSHDGTAQPTLSDLGITRKQSSLWQQLAAIPKATRESYIASADEVTTAGLLREGWQGTKAARRAEREEQLGEKTKAAAASLGVKVHNVVLADPPWRIEAYSRDTGLNKAADNHYPTMPLDQIAAMKVPAAKDSVLFLWATTPMLVEALEVMRAWGFTYKSHFVWVKPNIGTGRWNRNQHELLLVGTRGAIPAPAPGEQFRSVINAAATGRHSAKPAIFHEIIEGLFPNLPKLEMFARKQRKGWTCWGNEVD